MLEGLGIADRVLIRNNTANDQCTFQECFEKALIILLGNPGEGKTTLFKAMALREENAMFIPVRQFIRRPISQFQGKVLYLDGLDEERGTQASGTGVLAEVCQRLYELAPSKLRVSCRFADWHGDLALDDFKDISSAHDSTVTVRLKGFSNDDLRIFLAQAGVDPINFMQEAARRGILELLRSPLNLNLILGIIRSTGSWPSTKSQLYEKAVKNLLEERNPTHKQNQALYSVLQLEEQSEELCALQMVSDIAGFSFVTTEPTEEYPSFRETVKDAGLAKAALSTGLFLSEDGLTAAPYHRSIAEYMAARYLARQIRSGIPARRVLALISGADGGVLSEFRGLGGWLATLSSDCAEALIQRDPMGIIAYGDVSSMPNHLRSLLLWSLESVAKTDPYFRIQHWDPAQYGPLACRALIDVLNQKLSDYSQCISFTCCILDAIANGEKLPELLEPLRKILLDSQYDELHPLALKALIFNGATIEELEKLLASVGTGGIPDTRMELRGILLSQLYPMVIDESKISSFLVEPPSSFFGSYHEFLTELSATAVARLPVLMDGLAQHLVPCFGQSSFDSFLGRVLCRTITNHGSQVATARLMGWLSVVQDEYAHSCIQNEDKVAIKSWLDSQSMVLMKLYEHWISTAEGSDLFKSWYYFRNTIFEAEPKDFTKFLLEKLEQSSDQEMKLFLFGRLIYQTYHQRAEASLTVAELFEVADRHQGMRDRLIANSYSEISEQRLEYNQRKMRKEEKEEYELAQTRAALKGEIDNIKLGKNLRALIFLAEHYQDKDDTTVENPVGFERIRRFFVDDRDALQAISGFIALVERNGGVLDPANCGRASADRKILKVVFPFRIGMNLLWNCRSECVAQLPKESVRAALSCALAYGRFQELPWLRMLVDCHRTIVLEAILDYLRPIFTAKVAKAELSTIEYYDHFDAIKVEIVKRIFEEYKSFTADTFETLLKIAVEKNIDISPFLADWDQSFAEDNTGRLYLLAARYLLGIDNDLCLGESVRDRHHAAVICQFIESSIEKRPDFKAQVPFLMNVIREFGTFFRIEDIDYNGFKSEEVDAARFVQWAMESLAKITSPDALSAFKILKCMDTLGSWLPVIRHLATNQLRLFRDESHTYPVLAQVTQSLSNGRPANVADLHAIMVEHLISLADEYKNGSENRNRIFWNFKDGRPDTPHTENECRDLLMYDLRQKTDPLGVAIEKEGNYSEEKRADIKAIYMSSMNVPVEIKRHYHREVWSAVSNQLISRYVIDPGASGYGVFLVLWFGINFKRPPSPPPGYEPPKSGNDMQLILEDLVPFEHRHRISVVVIDVSSGFNWAAKKSR